MSGTGVVMAQGCEDYGRDAVFLEAEEEDSQNESGEWERGFEERERGEGSGESENEAPVGASGQERDGGSSSEEEVEGEDEEESESEEDYGREGEGEDATQVTLGHSVTAAGNENTLIEEPGVRDVSQNDRGSQSERELLLQRVGQLPPPPPSYRHPTPHTLTPSTPSTPTVYYTSPVHRRQWLLELTLVLLVATLLVTVCSRVSYNWLLRLYSIVPEKPI